MKFSEVFVGLGSNLGDRLGYLRKAVNILAKTQSPFRIHTISPLYESQALLTEGAPAAWNIPYLNIVLSGETDLEPQNLLRFLKEIEKKLGRPEHSERWSPRVMDIDILSMDGLTLESQALRLPHPGILSRPFVLLPLADICPDFVLSNERTAAEMVSPWRRLPADQIPCQTTRTTHCLSQSVGILNLTPDSFSDGGRYWERSKALLQAEALLKAGADVIDLGAESTRPGANPVSTEEEWQRIEPTLSFLRDQGSNWGVKISIDTRNPEIAARSIELGADWINDVSACEDPRMIRILANSEVNVVIMHHTTIPANPTVILNKSIDPIDEILNWGRAKIDFLASQGISKDRVIFDPGIGFGKSVEHQWEILRCSEAFRDLGVPILIGHSRKSFLTSICSEPAPDRDPETLAISLNQASKGIDFLRIHAGREHIKGLRAWAKLDGCVQWRA